VANTGICRGRTIAAAVLAATLWQIASRSQVLSEHACTTRACRPGSISVPRRGGGESRFGDRNGSLLSMPHPYSTRLVLRGGRQASRVKTVGRVGMDGGGPLGEMADPVSPFSAALRRAKVRKETHQEEVGQSAADDRAGEDPSCVAIHAPPSSEASHIPGTSAYILVGSTQACTHLVSVHLRQVFSDSDPWR
jgi:hypothetical protein